MLGRYGLKKNLKRAKIFLQGATKHDHADAIKALKDLKGGALELEPGPCAACGATGSKAHRCQAGAYTGALIGISCALFVRYVASLGRYQ
jgi:TPR repeat protein